MIYVKVRCDILVARNSFLGTTYLPHIYYNVKPAKKVKCLVVGKQTIYFVLPVTHLMLLHSPVLLSPLTS